MVTYMAPISLSSNCCASEKILTVTVLTGAGKGPVSSTVSVTIGAGEISASPPVSLVFSDASKVD